MEATYVVTVDMGHSVIQASTMNTTEIWIVGFVT
jgi:hypothetical protein